MYIKSFHDLVDAVMEINKRFQTNDIWWRGQASASDEWTLIPGVHRRKLTIAKERSLMVRFIQRAATRHERCPDGNDFSGWLFLMQHHRLPTRLLDWTESPLVAAYFAVKALSKESGVLWALAPMALNEAQLGEPVIPSPGSNHVAELVAAPFRKEVAGPEKTVAISTFENDIRMLVQASAFTIHGDATALEVLHGNEGFLVRYEIPAASKAHILAVLRVLAIREANLFPDLDHLATDIGSLYG